MAFDKRQMPWAVLLHDNIEDLSRLVDNLTNFPFSEFGRESGISLYEPYRFLFASLRASRRTSSSTRASLRFTVMKLKKQMMLKNINPRMR